MTLLKRAITIAACVFCLHAVTAEAANGNARDGGLTQLIANLSTMNASEYRVAFASLTPTVRTRLWRDHLLTALSSQQLTREQRAIISDALRFVTVEMFSADRDGAVWKEKYAAQFRDLSARSKLMFDDETRAAIFFRVVDRPPIADRATTVSNRKTRSDNRLTAISTSLSGANFASVQEPYDPSCYCHYDPILQYTDDDDPTCFAYTICTYRCFNGYPTGCGFLGQEECNGICCNPRTGGCSP